MLLNILINPNPELRKKSQPITKNELDDKNFKKTVTDMAETMIKKDGVGLAAPQVGILKRLIVVNTEDGPVAFINPEIKKKSWRKIIMEEGCLSVPGVFANVKRPTSVKISFWDMAGQKHTLNAKDILARVLQHEIDHLDGILFIDKIKNK
ncbi:MAG TPA: peptide deformylase [bacterium]|nr:peptide deformylase [bacterium]